MKPRLLDLFCGAGGAAMGYSRVGFEVVGVDIAPQPNYPFEFVRMDVFEFLEFGWDSRIGPHRWLGAGAQGFDAIHASPPCQAHVQWNGINRERNGSVPDHPDLIAPTRELLRSTGLPYVIENVVGAPLENSVMLCGSHFGLGVRRHRLFESNMLLLRERGCQHDGEEVAVYGKLDGRRIWTRSDGSIVRAARTLEEAQQAMGIDWMEWRELCEAIPPAYTELIGHQLMQHVLSQRSGTAPLSSC